MEKPIFFNTEAELIEYGKQNKLEYVEDGIKNAKEDWGEYFEPFKEIEGCDVLFCIEDPERWSSITLCIRWRGVLMTHYNEYNRGEKTQKLRLAIPLDRQGLEVRESIDNCPLQKIGKPTAKKLDEWKTYLLQNRKWYENFVEQQFAVMLAKINECCTLFPEAKSTKWEKDYWTFHKDMNGVEYTLQIKTDGRIYEHYELSELYKYALSPAEIAVRLMNNGLNDQKKQENAYEALRQKANQEIEKYKGGKPY